ncbi:MAG: hypothetical protein M5U14_13160 [Acidimicrobiia bacterium]|nr:hypothetical protein [Acidimicrobiia bacterium]
MPTLAGPRQHVEQGTTDVVDPPPATDGGAGTEPNGRADLRAWLAGPVPGRAGAWTGVAWLVALPLVEALEPEPVAGASFPWYATLLGVALLGALALAAAGLLAARRWGLVASLGAAGLLTAGTVACPVSGHHAWGAWWPGQLAVALTLTAVSVRALRRA